METDSRADHLAWCQARAYEYCDLGDAAQAFASFASDMRKHLETAEHAAITLGMIALMSGRLTTPEEMRHFLQGCH